jgi:hypothetical protein
MAFAKDTIKLGAAQAIFTDANIQEILIGGTVAGYQAKLGDTEYQSKGLTALCKLLWSSIKRG